MGKGVHAARQEHTEQHKHIRALHGSWLLRRPALPTLTEPPAFFTPRVDSQDCACPVAGRAVLLLPMRPCHWALASQKTVSTGHRHQSHRAMSKRKRVFRFCLHGHVSFIPRISVPSMLPTFLLFLALGINTILLGDTDPKKNLGRN